MAGKVRLVLAIFALALMSQAVGLAAAPEGDPAPAKTEPSEPAPKSAPARTEPKGEPAPAKTEPAPDPEPEPQPKREPKPKREGQPRPAKKPATEPQPPKTAPRPAPRTPPPADERGVPLPDNLKEGVADRFSAIADSLLPGRGKPEKIPYPHLGDSRPIPEPVPQKVEVETPSVWARLTDRFGSSRTLINVIVLVVLVLIFGLYRLRAGRSRYL